MAKELSNKQLRERNDLLTDEDIIIFRKTLTKIIKKILNQIKEIYK